MAQGICSFALLTDSSSLLLGAWKDFPNSPFLPACKNLILSTESLSALYIVISWVFRTFRGITTFVWGFSPSQSLLRVGSFMPYPGLFVQFVFFFSLMSSAAVVGFWLCCVFLFWISCQTVWSLWDIIEITDWRFQAKPLYLMAPYLSPKWKTFRGCAEPAPESHWIFWALVGEILMI